MKGVHQTGDCLIRNARLQFHEELLSTGLLSVTDGVPSNSDKDSPASVSVAAAILDQLPPGVLKLAKRLPGQTAGAIFERVTREYVERTFTGLAHLRPGRWSFPANKKHITGYEQYSHLEELENLATDRPELAVAIGRNYVIEPDVVIVRHPEDDAAINQAHAIVDEEHALRSVLRAASGAKPFLHASISCKWTLRNDRAQNARSEALILVRNRKGRLPHTVVLTADPLPSRLASLALGTGDLDCVYHFALHELINAVSGDQHADEMVSIMVEGKRLKDVSDLPLDLAV